MLWTGNIDPNSWCRTGHEPRRVAPSRTPTQHPPPSYTTAHRPSKYLTDNTYSPDLPRHVQGAFLTLDLGSCSQLARARAERPSPAFVFFFPSTNTPQQESGCKRRQKKRLLVMDLAILNHGEKDDTLTDTPSSNFTPHQQKNVWASTYLTCICPFFTFLLNSFGFQRIYATSTAHIHQSESYSSEAKWTYRRISFGGCLLYDFKGGLSAAASSRPLCQEFGDNAVNERTARNWFQNSGSEICPTEIKFEQDDYRPCITKPCRRPLRKTVVKCVVNFPDNSTLPVKRLDIIFTTYVRRKGRASGFLTRCWKYISKNEWQPVYLAFSTPCHIHIQSGADQ
ncbi:histone-lysine N-methyltransferase SETMAR [Trichonephila clavipes]|nr:histone-lysine N-methyltransferase SETMAR [Trichonephila clavipes]